MTPEQYERCHHRDSEGRDWFACDPWPCWFRWITVDGQAELQFPYQVGLDDIDWHRTAGPIPSEFLQ